MCTLYLIYSRICSLYIIIDFLDVHIYYIYIKNIGQKIYNKQAICLVCGYYFSFSMFLMSKTRCKGRKWSGLTDNMLGEFDERDKVCFPGYFFLIKLSPGANHKFMSVLENGVEIGSLRPEEKEKTTKKEIYNKNTVKQ